MVLATDVGMRPGADETTKTSATRRGAPAPSGKKRRRRLPRWAEPAHTVAVILIGVGLMIWPWVLDRLEASGVFNQISAVSSTVDALSEEERERIFLPGALIQ